MLYILIKKISVYIKLINNIIIKIVINYKFYMVLYCNTNKNYIILEYVGFYVLLIKYIS